MQLRKWLKRIDILLILSFIAGLIPAFLIIHILVVDFSGFYFQALSYLNFKSHAYQIIRNYCENPINTGVNARAPTVPLLMAGSISVFGKTLMGIYFPFLIAKILIIPLTYLIAKYYLPKKLAFFSSLLLLFIPKLQTYSFAALEADVYIALFYALALYFYLKSDKLIKTKYLLLSSLALSFGALSKSTGFSIALGFILAIIIENIGFNKNLNKFKKLYLYIFTFVLIVGPYILWTLGVHQQLYLSTHKDKSINYIITNLPSLIETIPIYLGISLTGAIKAKIVSSFLLLVFLTGLIKTILNKWLTLVLPTFITLVLISTLSSCLLGGNIPGSYEFITILGFTMIPASIILFIGLDSVLNFLWNRVFQTKTPYFITIAFVLLIFFKYINNYFTSPYTLQFIPGEYYISLPTVIKNQQQLTDVKFKMVGNLRLFDGPIIHRVIRQQFNNYRFDPFSPLYKRIIYIFVILSFSIVIFTKETKK